MTLTRNQRAELFEAHGGICWRCGLPIDPVKQKWHEGHTHAPKALGGTKIAPEHEHCNLADAPNVTKAVAKANRLRADRLGIPKKSKHPMPCGRKSKFKKRMDGKVVERARP